MYSTEPILDLELVVLYLARTKFLIPFILLKTFEDHFYGSLDCNRSVLLTIRVSRKFLQAEKKCECCFLFIFVMAFLQLVANANMKNEKELSVLSGPLRITTIVFSTSLVVFRKRSLHCFEKRHGYFFL